jgi:hypothetical protein
MHRSLSGRLFLRAGEQRRHLPACLPAVRQFNPREIELRSPGPWLTAIKSPTFVFEGTGQGNLGCLRAMAGASTNSAAHFFAVRGATHFSTLAPTNRNIAQKMLADNGDTCDVSFTEDELSRPFAR